MKKVLCAFLMSIFTSHSAMAAKVQINCDLRLLNAERELDKTVESPLVEKYLILEEKSEKEIEKDNTFTNVTEKGSGCFVHGRVGWKMVYDEDNNIQLTVINPQGYQQLCAVDDRDRQLAGRTAFKVSTQIQMKNPPDRFLLNLPTPTGINAKGVNNISEGKNVRFIHLQCHRVQ